MRSRSHAGEAGFRRTLPWISSGSEIGQPGVDLPRLLGNRTGVRIYEEHSIGIYDCYTFPAFRSRGIYTDSLIRMLRQIRHEGVSRSLIAVAPDNIPSIRAIEKVGFSPLYRATISQRFGRTRLRESSSAPDLRPRPEFTRSLIRARAVF